MTKNKTRLAQLYALRERIRVEKLGLDDESKIPLLRLEEKVLDEIRLEEKAKAARL